MGEGLQPRMEVRWETSEVEEGRSSCGGGHVEEALEYPG